jgi:hypothetical protein
MARFSGMLAAKFFANVSGMLLAAVERSQANQAGQGSRPKTGCPARRVHWISQIVATKAKSKEKHACGRDAGSVVSGS